MIIGQAPELKKMTEPVTSNHAVINAVFALMSSLSPRLVQTRLTMWIFYRRAQNLFEQLRGHSVVSTLALFLALGVGFGNVLEASAEETSDVRIVIDISGSMKETDPQNLRSAAVKMLVEMLPDGSQSGVWTFGRYVNMLVPHGVVDQAWRQKALASSAMINSAGQRTNLTGALDKALWEQTLVSGNDYSVILLTDGKIDMAPAAQGNLANQASFKELMSRVLPRYKSLGVKIHTLALSDASDKTLLQQLAVETDGLFLQPQQAEDLSRSFLQAFDQSAPAEQVPLVGNRFSIDTSVEEFTALVFRRSSAKDTRLIAPSGKIYSRSSAGNSGVRWHRDLNFDLITVKQPEAGEWQVDADIDPDNRIQILSDLKLDVEGIHPAIFSGDELDLEIALTNEGQRVSEKALLQLTDLTLKITAPDGKTGSMLLSDPESVPDDGLFKHQLARMTQPGEYRFELQASGRTFKRQRTFTATLSEPFKVASEADVEQQEFRIYVSTQSPVVDAGLSRVLVRVIHPDGSSLIHPMVYDREEARWQYSASATHGLGQYQYQLNIRGVTTGGKAFRSQPEELFVIFPLGSTSTLKPQPELTMPSDLAVDPAKAKPAEVDIVQGPAEDQAKKPDPSANSEPEDEPKSPAAPTPTAEAEQTKADDEAEESSSGLPWLWIALGAVLFLLLVGGGLAFWLIRRKKAASDSIDDAQPAKEGASAEPQGGKGSSEDAASDIQEMDDFEAFMSEGEDKVADVEVDNGGAATGMGDASTDIDPLSQALAPDDLDTADDDEDWGEFDEDTNIGGPETDSETEDKNG
jgi:uncharacterized protein (TIGR03503 family)